VKVVKAKGRLKVTPVGTRTHDRGEGLSLEDVRAAIRTILLCLEFLHEKGFVHRDLRWANIIRSFSCNHGGTIESCKFLVIDFEFAEYNGAKMNIVDYIHNEVITFGEKYSSLHDLKLVGKMVRS
jgi:serine/threonine protein kinase